MSTKEKAFNLFGLIRTEISLLHHSELLKDKIAKNLSLITVDNMMLTLPFTDKHKSLNEYAIQMQKYLEQIRQEIEKL